MLVFTATERELSIVDKTVIDSIAVSAFPLLFDILYTCTAVFKFELSDLICSTFQIKSCRVLYSEKTKSNPEHKCMPITVSDDVRIDLHYSSISSCLLIAVS